MTNGAGPNGVLMYNRMSDGTLKGVATFFTNGKGTGAGLGTQGALAVNNTGRFLLVPNAGSNDISVLQISAGSLTTLGKTTSGGTMPGSIAIYGHLVYVLNIGSPNSVTGFLLHSDGTLVALPGSMRSLSGSDVTPPQVGFSPDGQFLIVTEKATNLIDVFPVHSDGTLGPIVSNPSSGMTPFGFAFGNNHQLFVSEAFGGAANASALSSYTLNADGTLTTITGSAPTMQTAACWVALGSGNQQVYTTDTGSATVTGFGVGPSGTVTLLNSDGDTGMTPAGSEPIDEAFSPDGKFLYVLTSTVPGISSFSAAGDGSLTPAGTSSAPASASGLVVR